MTEDEIRLRIAELRMEIDLLEEQLPKEGYSPYCVYDLTSLFFTYSTANNLSQKKSFKPKFTMIDEDK